MRLGENLCNARRKSGLSQQAVAEKLGVSRQTISKWETDETLPDICQSKKLADLYHCTLDELIDFDVDVQHLEQVIENTSEQTQQKVDWNKLWAKKYPILATYRQQVRVEEYAQPLRDMLNRLQDDYHLSALDAFLVLKDILGALWRQTK